MLTGDGSLCILSEYGLSDAAAEFGGSRVQRLRKAWTCVDYWSTAVLRHRHQGILLKYVSSLGLTVAGWLEDLTIISGRMAACRHGTRAVATAHILIQK